MRLVLTALFLCVLLFADDRSVDRSDAKSFFASKNIKNEIKNEIIRDLNLTFDRVQKTIDKRIQREFLRTKNAYEEDIKSLRLEITQIKKEVTLLKKINIDLNYNRNLRDDRLSQIEVLLKTIEKRIRDLEGKKDPPKKEKDGEKI